MSGDNIDTLKMVKEQPLNMSDLEYTTKLLKPFQDIIIERFNETSTSSVNVKPCNRSLFVFAAIGIILFINFPKIREKSGLNEYILWLISALLLMGILY
jgi:hypothetical protein